MTQFKGDVANLDVRIAEDPTNAANLMPIVTHVLQGKRDQVMVRSLSVSPGSRADAFATTRFMAPTTIRQMVRVSATLFTSSIWPRHILRLSGL